MNYRRYRVEGATYFFTVVTNRRRPLFRHDKNVDILRVAFREEMVLRRFTVDAMVVLPDHLHCIWTLPEGDHNFSTRWRRIKTRVTQALRSGDESAWQGRFWEHAIRDEEDFARHTDYIHYNPVKHGLAPTPARWRHTSFHRYVKERIYPPDWGGAEEIGSLDISE